MLEGNVHIAAHFGIDGHLFQDVLRKIGGIGVMDAQPLDAFHGGKLPQKLCQGTAPVKVQAIVGGILGDNDQLPDAFGGKGFSLFHQFLHRDGTVIAADERNGAIGAAAVASF